jgi:hypothetical protein
MQMLFQGDIFILRKPARVKWTCSWMLTPLLKEFK